MLTSSYNCDRTIVTDIEEVPEPVNTDTKSSEGIEYMYCNMIDYCYYIEEDMESVITCNTCW